MTGTKIESHILYHNKHNLKMKSHKQNKRIIPSDHRSSAISDLLREHALKNPPPPPRALTDEELNVLKYGQEQYTKRKEYVQAEKAKGLRDEDTEIYLYREAYRLFPNPKGGLPRGFDYRWLSW